MKTVILAILTAASLSTVRAEEISPLLLLHERPIASLVQQTPSYQAWKISLVPMIAGQALDAASSYNRLEVNPMLAGPNGRFGAKGVAVKIGVSGAILGAEYLVIRRYPGSSRIFSKLNWAAGFVTIGVSAHNFAIR